MSWSDASHSWHQKADKPLAKVFILAGASLDCPSAAHNEGQRDCYRIVRDLDEEVRGRGLPWNYLTGMRGSNC